MSVPAVVLAIELHFCGREQEIIPNVRLQKMMTMVKCHFLM